MQKNGWKGKRILITGVCGTVGKELFNLLKDSDAAEIVGIDNNESELFFLEQAFIDDDNINFFLCDIRDQESLETRMRGMDVVLHSAAFKHVGLCEHSPRSAVGTNIIGCQNVIDAATIAGVERVLFTSSDKAVNPTTVMGTSKLMGERLMTAANMRRRDSDPIFGVTRFGNVLGSRGSVIPLFRSQIAQGGPVTVTHQDMTRFIMSLREAVHLVLEAALTFKGGEVFITKMPVMRIMDLAEIMIEELAPSYGHNPKDIEVKFIGPRPSEKMYEELMTGEECGHALESEEFFIIKPALKNNGETYSYDNMQVKTAEMPYNSDIAKPMDKELLRKYLHTHNLLDTAEEAMTQSAIKKAVSA